MFGSLHLVAVVTDCLERLWCFHLAERIQVKLKAAKLLVVIKFVH